MVNNDFLGRDTFIWIKYLFIVIDIPTTRE